MRRGCLQLCVASLLLCCWLRPTSSGQHCDFVELVDSIESELVQAITAGSASDGGQYTALWSNCTELYSNLLLSLGVDDPVQVHSTCEAESECDWNALVERYLLQGYTGSSAVLQGCAVVRDHAVSLNCANPQSDPPEPQQQAESEPPESEPEAAALQDVLLEAGSVSLPLADSGMLATIVLVSDPEGGERRRLSEDFVSTADQSAFTPLARSYNGNEWEGTMPLPVSFDCSSGSTCTAVLPPAPESGRYELRVFNGTTRRALAPDVAAARFLTQATFGATIAEIRNVTGASLEETELRIEQWVQEQMGMEPTLHRVYLRKRTNPPIRNQHHMMMRCV